MSNESPDKSLRHRLLSMAADPIVGPLCSALLAEAAAAVPSARKESDGVDWRMRAERAVASLRSFDGPLADYIVKISTTDGGTAK